eukprot:CAMPEP_0170627078 /NCGR_PEP_ID=MMETSP0224-20130122/31746_1 /TAXON_ID=285029 /ORGANISM="Togula jolla, Strain CCCM 725" /LENGTH=88 /DNA_ID=CAMNT_0010953987 /DNA_START=87 /DNA_END=349 /DNA_ORIENTATION=-
MGAGSSKKINAGPSALAGSNAVADAQPRSASTTLARKALQYRGAGATSNASLELLLIKASCIDALGFESASALLNGQLGNVLWQKQKL